MSEKDLERRLRRLEGKHDGSIGCIGFGLFVLFLPGLVSVIADTWNFWEIVFTEWRWPVPSPTVFFIWE